MNETTDYSDYPDYYHTKWKYAGVLTFSETVQAFSFEIQLYLVITVIVINIFHLIILSQKLLRSNPVNIILIGIAISDLIFLTYFIYQEAVLFLSAALSVECTPPSTWPDVFLEVFFKCSQDISLRVSTWLGVIIALIRALSVRYPTNPTIQKLLRPSKSCLAILSVFLISFLVSSLNYGRLAIDKEKENWKPPETCTMYPLKTALPQYFLANNRFFTDKEINLIINQIYLFLNGSFQLAPPILYPFLAGILVFELKNAHKRRRKLTNSSRTSDNSDKSGDNTTKVVIWMTVFYFIAGAPVGLAQLFLMKFSEDTGMLFIISTASTTFITITIFHCAVNCLICLSLNSQYRNTIKSMLGISDKKLVQQRTISVVSGSSTKFSH